MNILGKPLFYHPDLSSEHLTMSEEESRHCALSLRFKEGDNLFLTDGKGLIVQAQLNKANPKGCFIKVLGRENIPHTHRFKRLIIAPPKTGERLDFIMEKAVEIGVDEIVFIETRYAERDKVNLERLQKIAISAMKQSKQAFLPNLVGMVKWKQFIEQKAEGIKLIAAIVDSHQSTVTSKHLATELTHQSSVISLQSPVNILIGPEGDFSEEEVKQAIEKGFVPVSLGKNILRTETAAIYALTLINAFA